MKLNEVIARIIARGFTVETVSIPMADGMGHNLTVLNSQGNEVPWPTIKTGKNGNVSDVSLPSFRGGKVTGLGDYPTAAIYGDLYLNHAGHPAAAEKAITALLAVPVPQTVLVDPFASVPAN